MLQVWGEGGGDGFATLHLLIHFGQKHREGVNKNKPISCEHSSRVQSPHRRHGKTGLADTFTKDRCFFPTFFLMHIRMV